MVITQIKDCLTALHCIITQYLPAKIASKRRSQIKHSSIWILSERPDEARDNAYHLYKYLKSKNPEIDVKYAINPHSNDATRIDPNDIIPYGGKEHFQLLYRADVIASTDFGMGMPDSASSTLGGVAIRRHVRFLRPNAKFVFLQHGITHNNIRHAYQDKMCVDLFICGAKTEYKAIRSEFGYNENEVALTGFPRFDRLMTTVPQKRQVLFMPTWRAWLDDSFSESGFRNAIQEFLSSENLATLLEEYSYTLLFYPHPRFQMYTDLFETGSKNIVLAKQTEHDIQDLMLESALFITDYSSTAFDFAYMNKPVLYFQFDDMKFRAKHYSEGYFNYEVNGFGPVCPDLNSLLSELKALLESGTNMSEMYRERVNNFFSLRDACNCQRIYKAISQCLNFDVDTRS